MEQEWLKEPDEVKFEHAGFKCLILRNPSLKHLNGYVALPKGHPYYGKHYDNIYVDIHGGLTFSRGGNGEEWEKGYWWLGFDTGHYMDYSPGLTEQLKLTAGIRSGPEEHYRNIHYVTKEVKHLAEQLKIENIAIRRLLDSDKYEEEFL